MLKAIECKAAELEKLETCAYKSVWKLHKSSGLVKPQTDLGAKSGDFLILCREEDGSLVMVRVL